MNADDGNAFSEHGRSSNSSCPRDSSSCALYSYAAGIRFIGEFQRPLPLSGHSGECIGFTLTVCIATFTDFGILRAERYFVILDFFFVILGVLKVIRET